jgi:hypothetical protein
MLHADLFSQDWQGSVERHRQGDVSEGRATSEEEWAGKQRREK